VKIVCSTNMPCVEQAFSTIGEPVVLSGREISAADVKDAEVLAIRSTTRVDAALLDGSAVRFVGTATIGTDHLDIPYLESRGIAWSYSPGCNALGVSEYIAAGLLYLAERDGFALAGLTMGVIGVGNVGSRVVRKARALGMQVLMCDPPREAGIEPDGGIDLEPGPFVSRDTVLAEADVLTVHVPLTRSGEHATEQMCDSDFFAACKAGATFINAARGALVSSDALMAALESGPIQRAIMDTWEGEPVVREDLLRRVDIASPHIAGYSYDGKVRGTAMVYDAACRCLGIRPTWSMDTALRPDASAEPLRVGVQGSLQAQLADVVSQAYGIMVDDAAMRAAQNGDDTARAAAFDALRKHYPERREFPNFRVQGEGAAMACLRGLGFVGDSECPILSTE